MNVGYFTLILTLTICSNVDQSYGQIDTGASENALSTEVIDMPEILPEFRSGAYQSYYEFIRENLEYPEKAKRDGVEGVVFIQFTVNQSGNVTDPKVFRGVREDLDSAAIQVIRKSPTWTPAQSAGRSVSVLMTVPIDFSLD